MKHVKAIFDNAGKTADRYTVIFSDGDMIASSTEPFSPHGIGQHVGNLIDNYCKTAWGGQGTTRPKTQRERNLWLNVDIAMFKKQGNIGKLIKKDQLPEDVKKFIQQEINN
jgi:hypothetical protein